VSEDEEVEVGSPLVKIGDGSGGGDGGSEDKGGEAEDKDGEAEEAPAEEESSESAEEPAEDDAPTPAAGESGGGESTPEEDSPAEETSGDSEEVTLPALGESVTEGTVTRWLVDVGDEVEVDQPLLEVSTDKVDTEVPSPVAGTIQELKVSEDEEVEVGAVLALVGSGASGSAPTSEEPTQEAAEAAEEKEQKSEPAAEPKQEAAPKEEPKQEPKEESASAQKSE